MRCVGEQEAKRPVGAARMGIDVGHLVQVTLDGQHRFGNCATRISKQIPDMKADIVEGSEKAPVGRLAEDDVFMERLHL